MTVEPDIELEENDTVIPSSPSDISRAIEAILMVADEPISPRQLANIIGCSNDDIEIAAAALIQSYADDQRGFVLQRVAGGFRFQSHPDLAPVVERFVLDGQASRLSAAALETMAIVAYKQPISRNQISAIRGVNAEGVVRTLEARGYVEEIARDPGPGRAALYGTTPQFLERLGLNSIDELPPLGQFVPDADVVEALETTLLVNPDPVAAVDAGDETSALDAVALDAVALDASAFDTAMANSAHDEIAHDEIAHDEIAHDEIAHDEIAHDEIAHDGGPDDEYAEDMSPSDEAGAEGE